MCDTSPSLLTSSIARLVEGGTDSRTPRDSNVLLIPIQMLKSDIAYTCLHSGLGEGETGGGLPHHRG